MESGRELHPAGREALTAECCLLSPKMFVRNHRGMVLVFPGQVNTWESGWEMGLQMPEREGRPGWGQLPSFHGLEDS